MRLTIKNFLKETKLFFLFNSFNFTKNKNCSILFNN